MPRIAANISTMLSAISLDTFKNRIVNALSKSNKHKLSLAIALIGNPLLLLLNKPSTGIDVAAKYAMWKTLLSVVALGYMLFITTYIIEDTDTLATRIGIIKR